MKRRLILLTILVFLLAGCKKEPTQPTDQPPETPSPDYATEEDRERFLSAYQSVYTWEETADAVLASADDFYWRYPDNYIAVGQGAMVFDGLPWLEGSNLVAVYLPDESRTVSLEHISALFPESTYGFNDFFGEDYVCVPGETVDYYFYPEMVEYRKSGMEIEPKTISDDERATLRVGSELEGRLTAEAEQMALKGETETERFGFGYLFPDLTAQSCTPGELAEYAGVELRLNRQMGALNLELTMEHITLSVSRPEGQWSFTGTDRFLMTIDSEYFLKGLIDSEAKPDGNRSLVFIDQFMLGYWDKQNGWNSGDGLVARDLFFVNGYYTYTMSEYTGKTTKLADFDLPTKFNNDLFSDNAKRYMLWNTMRFQPADGYFTISGTHDPRPDALPTKSGEEQSDAAAVRTVLDSVGLYEASVVITDVYEVDVAQDGAPGRLVLAQTHDEGAGGYTLVLYGQDGIFETVKFEWYAAGEYGPGYIIDTISFDDGLPFNAFDANNDGVLELYFNFSIDSMNVYECYERSGRVWRQVLSYTNSAS